MTIVEDKKMFEVICKGLTDDGFVVVDGAFTEDFLVKQLRQVSNISAEKYTDAGIGRDNTFQTNHKIRGDQVLWLDEQLAENQNYLQWAENLRSTLNQYLYLGLKEYECMFAHYPTGACYQKHVDVFKTDKNLSKSNRKISTILYLNSDWQPTDGGELLLYQHDQEQAFKRILPELGRLVVFISDGFPHEVLAAQKSRYSLTGWFRS